VGSDLRQSMWFPGFARRGIRQFRAALFFPNQPNFFPSNSLLFFTTLLAIRSLVSGYQVLAFPRWAVDMPFCV
jgi:hypothetical protein